MRRKSLREVPTNSVAYEVDDIVSLAACVGPLVCPEANGDNQHRPARSRVASFNASDVGGDECG